MRAALATLPIAFLITSQPVRAEETSTICHTLQQSVNDAASSSDRYYRGVEAADMTALANMSAGDLRAAAERAQAARTKAIPALREYAQALEDLGYRLKVCAR